ncbi:MAG TPA: Dabb family protein [Vicinamibacterales bacterium]|nr:Dabb family protein [Vicinamibacterales bacterium]
MLVHIVCFKYKPTVDTATRVGHRERLAALKSLDGVVDLKVGEDVVRSPRSYDTALVITFPDRAALDAYQKNDRHVPVAQYGASLSDHIVAVDFEI